MARTQHLLPRCFIWVVTLAPGKTEWKEQGSWTQTVLGSSPGSTTC